MKLHSHLLVVLPVLLIFCAKQSTSDSLAKVGNTIITKENFESVNKIMRIYPTKLSEHFPAQRSIITYMVESEVLFSKASSDLKNKIEKSTDWQWKKRYYPAQTFLIEYLATNLGFTEEQLTAYYDTHKDLGIVTVKAIDTTKKDSVYYKPLNEIKERVVNALFLEKNKPDSAFMKTFGDSLPPQQVINDQWTSHVRNTLPAFFMKKYYKETYGVSYPDSLKDVFGKGKAITPEDLDVILSWVPEERRGYYSNAEGKKELVEWLLKWKLFAQQVIKEGLDKKGPFKNMAEWSWKLEVANKYVAQKIEPKLVPSIKIDTQMVKYAVCDESGKADFNIDSAQLNRKIAFFRNQMINQKLDSAIYVMRKSAGVKFFQDDWKDNRVQDPVKLMTQADSLRDSAKTEEAERIYSSLSNEFSFLPEGKKATIELAKIQTERQQYYQAITNYRKALVWGSDKDKLCNTFFMIGFIYDEYLDKPELAEINYKYVLKSTPGCELTDDAEFMMLHLGEPMSSVEELQAEASRQGRKIDNTETDTTGGSDTISIQ